jgi:hypothetical protein
MRESCSSGSVGEREGNDPLYPEDCGNYVKTINAIAGLRVLPFIHCDIIYPIT